MIARLVGIVAVVVAILAFAAFPGAAQGRGVQAGVAASGDCPKPLPYPQPPTATIATSANVVTVGQEIEVSGTGYCPDEDITITISGKVVGTAHSDADGNFDPPVIVPGPASEQELCGTGETGLARNADCLTLTTRDAGAAASNSSGPGAGSNDGGGTAFTGVQVSLLAALALLLIAGGVAFATAGRSRKTAA